LPELGELAVFNAVNFAVNQPTRGIAQENSTAASISLSLFLCPSDGGSWTSGWGMNNYRANQGAGIDNFPPAGQVGAFEFQRWISPAQFTDGLSTTALASERLRGDGDTSRWNLERDYWFADLGVVSREAAVAACSTPPSPDPYNYSRSGSTWMGFGYDQTLYNHVIPPNASAADCSLDSYLEAFQGGEDAGIHAARSHHAGGVNVITADGSGRFVRSGIAIGVWRALGTRSGGEVTSSGY